MANNIILVLLIISYICAEGKQIFVFNYEQKEELCGNTNNETNIKWKKQEEKLKDEETVAESGRLFLRNLTYTTTEDDVRKAFEKYGKDIITLV